MGPQKRGFSYIEIWVLGTQGIILFAIIEYGIVLAWKKYGTEDETAPSQMNHNGKWQTPKKPKNEIINSIDFMSFLTSLLLFLGFNISYWIWVILFK